MGKEYYENTKIKSEKTYKNDKLDGIIKVYYTNTQLQYQASFKNGFQEGISTQYYENGNIKKKILYKDGKVTDTLSYEKDELLKQK